jgi:hypothetical protein
MKKCTKCKKIKENNLFNKDKNRGDGLYLYCKSCRSEQGKKSYIKNIQNIKEYREKNKEIIHQKAREYAQRPDVRKRKLDYAKEWKKKNKDYMSIYMKKYNKEHYIPKENPKIPNLKHGKKHSKIYTTWQNLKIRCDKQKSKSWKNYGGRGITYDNKWKTFLGFYEDMGSSYKEGLSIERIDVNGNYCLSNCIWIPKNDQGKNTTRTRIVYWKGVKYKLFDLAKLLNINYSTLYNRIYIYKIPIDYNIKNYKKLK